MYFIKNYTKNSSNSTITRQSRFKKKQQKTLTNNSPKETQKKKVNILKDMPNCMSWENHYIKGDIIRYLFMRMVKIQTPASLQADEMGSRKLLSSLWSLYLFIYLFIFLAFLATGKSYSLPTWLHDDPATFSMVWLLLVKLNVDPNNPTPWYLPVCY